MATKHTAPVPIEGFDTYPSNVELALAWYSPHGAPVAQTLAEPLVGQGRSMRFAFNTSNLAGKHYAAICRAHVKWDLSGCDAVRFMFTPGKAGHHLTLELNIADAEGKNIHDLWGKTLEFAPGDDAPRQVTIAFADLAPNTKLADAPGSPVFKPADVIEVALYAGSGKGVLGHGVFVIDEIAGVVK